MTSPYQAFGLSCPAGGKFYICDKDSEFIGCCTSDPCNTTGCPNSDVRTSSFSTDDYSSLPAQECQSSDSLWYTCAFNAVPFMGCCTINPCKDNKLSCPIASLRAAKLSSIESNKQRFLHPNAKSSTTTTAPATSATASTVAGTSSALPAVNGEARSGLSTANIIGISVGVSAFVLIAIALIIWKCGWTAGKRRARRQAADTATAAAASSTMSPTMTQTNPAYQASGFPDKSSPANYPYRDSYTPSAMTAVDSPHDNVYSKPAFDSSTSSMRGSPYPTASTSAQDQRYSTLSQVSYSSTSSHPNGYGPVGYGNAPNSSMPVVFEMESTEVRSELSGGSSIGVNPVVAPPPAPVQPPQIEVSSPTVAGPTSPCSPQSNGSWSTTTPASPPAEASSFPLPPFLSRPVGPLARHDGSRQDLLG